MRRPTVAIVWRWKSNEDIQKHRLFGLTEFAFKYKATQNFQQFIEVLMPWLHEVECELGAQYAKIVLNYVVDVFPSGNYEQFTEMAQTYLSKELGEEAMTIAQELKQQGIQQGIQQESQKTALRMLDEKCDIQLISRVTHLSQEEIKRLAKKKAN